VVPDAGTQQQAFTSQCISSVKPSYCTPISFFLVLQNRTQGFFLRTVLRDLLGDVPFVTLVTEPPLVPAIFVFMSCPLQFVFFMLFFMHRIRYNFNNEKNQKFWNTRAIHRCMTTFGFFSFVLCRFRSFSGKKLIVMTIEALSSWFLLWVYWTKVANDFNKSIPILRLKPRDTFSNPEDLDRIAEVGVVGFVRK
jgi:hypothetical protein